ncbi:MAG: TatD family hydrolase [Bacteroidota bacterium]|nr:TatD family hydrolase [Bacteroidota bacterium]
MVLVDSHAHLYLEDFKDDIDNVIKDSIDNGIKYMILPNIDSMSIESMLALAARYPENCFPSIGIHPTSINENYQDELEAVEKEIKENYRKYCCIGEIGIDLYWDKTYQEQQEIAFIRQMKLAEDLKLPISIHSRNSMNEMIRILKKEKPGNVNGVFHCFPGNTIEANKVIEMGFKLGIGGVVTFKNAGIKDVVKNIPLEHIILETDAPYLTPVPYRGKRNESKYIRLIAEEVAKIKELSLEEVAEVTTGNALELFRIGYGTAINL